MTGFVFYSSSYFKERLRNTPENFFMEHSTHLLCPRAFCSPAAGQERQGAAKHIILYESLKEVYRSVTASLQSVDASTRYSAALFMLRRLWTRSFAKLQTQNKAALKLVNKQGEEQTLIGKNASYMAQLERLASALEKDIAQEAIIKKYARLYRGIKPPVFGDLMHTLVVKERLRPFDAWDLAENTLFFMRHPEIEPDANLERRYLNFYLRALDDQAKSVKRAYTFLVGKNEPIPAEKIFSQTPFDYTLHLCTNKHRQSPFCPLAEGNLLK